MQFFKKLHKSNYIQFNKNRSVRQEENYRLSGLCRIRLFCTYAKKIHKPDTERPGIKSSARINKTDAASSETSSGIDYGVQRFALSVLIK